LQALKALLRWISYLFHFTLCVLALAVSGVAYISRGSSLHLGMLPWTDQTLTRVLFFGGLAGLIIVLLAMRGVLRFLFALWSLTILVLIVRGYFLTGYHYRSPGEFQFALYLLAAALLSLFGALQLRVSRSRRKR
jgi:hypothetical protein